MKHLYSINAANLGQLNNPIDEFKNAMFVHGVTPPDVIIGDSKLHRFHVDGDRKGTLHGAYTLHLDNRPSGWAMSFKSGISFTWTLSGKREPMTAEMKKQINYARQVREAEKAKAHEEAAKKAQWLWAQAEPIADQSQHPYLIRKRIKPHGARLYKGALVISIYDESGAIVNLQFINPDGSKRFLSGGRKKGCCAYIGEPSETILIPEGWATGASLHEATGHYVIVALDAGNLKPVSEAIRKQHPTEKIILCGDNDLDGKGQLKAREAALACGGKVFIPPALGTDWNDYINQGGAV